MHFVVAQISFMDEEIPVEVACVTPGKQIVLKINVRRGTTLDQAVVLSKIADALPEIDLTQVEKGVFGQKRPDDWVLQAYDRVEIYRPLLFDPREARRRRAAAQKGS
jgi:uncharacterized protein